MIIQRSLLPRFYRYIYSSPTVLYRYITCYVTASDGGQHYTLGSVIPLHRARFREPLRKYLTVKLLS